MNVSTEFAQKILLWYQTNKRDLPWRDTQNPYKIWLSEIILQQTRVKQGLPYYEKFIANYPTIQNLANADLQDVLRLWQGLGYYARARNMHQTAQVIVQEYDGVFPATFKELLKLKGIGNYTAAAIASFAFNEKVAVLDGNVYRVLARFFGIHTDIASPKAQKEFSNLANQILPTEQVAQYNQAIMEFGALQCTPVHPKCFFCPLNYACVAYHEAKQQILPIKNNKIKIKERFFNYLVLQHKDTIALNLRQQTDIWQGLYDFLLHESYSLITDFEDITNKSLLLETTIQLKNESRIYKHILTHQIIWAKFWLLEIPSPTVTHFTTLNLQFFSHQAIEQLPKPILIDQYLKELVL